MLGGLLLILGVSKLTVTLCYKMGTQKQAAIAEVARDSWGKFWMGEYAWCMHLRLYSLQGEALAVRMAGQMLEANHINNAVIESDNKLVIKLCSTENVPPCECASILRNLVSSLNCAFSWVSRKCDGIAHWVEHLLVLPVNWVYNYPPQLTKFNVGSMEINREKC